VGGAGSNGKSRVENEIRKTDNKGMLSWELPLQVMIA
jgi:hypothetical protein